MRSTCYFCQLNSVRKLIQKFQPSQAISDEFVKQVHLTLNNHWEANNPLIATHIHQIARNVLNVNDLYSEEKKSANQILMDMYDYWKEYVNQSSKPYLRYTWTGCHQ